MAAKTNAEVIIGGKVYTLSGFESEEYLQRVASYINGKIAEIDEVEAFKHFTADVKAVLIELNIADDYFKAKSQVEKLELDLKAKERDIYNLKHDLISGQVQTETDSERIAELEAENKELKLNKARLEEALEDTLLGKVKTMKAEQSREEQKEQSREQNREERREQNREQNRGEKKDVPYANSKKDRREDKGVKGQA